MRLVGVIGRSKVLRFVFLALGMALLVGIVFALYQYPRMVLLSDVRHSKKIIVDWRLPKGYGTYQNIAYVLDDSTRNQFIRDLTDNLRLDYSRTEATIVPMIGIYLVNDNGEYEAYYAIRCAGGRCPSMDSLRKTASKGQPLSRIETEKIYDNVGLRSKWPHILPWPLCRYDYVLPVAPTQDTK
jgi:hypothetical protein